MHTYVHVYLSVLQIDFVRQVIEECHTNLRALDTLFHEDVKRPSFVEQVLSCSQFACDICCSCSARVCCSRVVRICCSRVVHRYLHLLAWWRHGITYVQCMYVCTYVRICYNIISIFILIHTYVCYLIICSQSGFCYYFS